MKLDKKSNDINIHESMGFATVLGIVFIVLKLCKVINWSWLWVLSPLWIPVAIGILLLAILIIMIFIGKFFKK